MQKVRLIWGECCISFNRGIPGVGSHLRVRSQMNFFVNIHIIQYFIRMLSNGLAGDTVGCLYLTVPRIFVKKSVTDDRGKVLTHWNYA